MTRRAFHLLMKAYPACVAREHGEEMWLAFRDSLADATHRGGIAVVALWLREIRAALIDGLGARVGRSPVLRSRRSRLWMASLADDVRAALRAVVARPGRALFVALVLGLGVGASVTVSQLADTILLRPPAHVVEPRDLVAVWYDFEGNRLMLTHPGFRELVESAAVFAELGAWAELPVHVGAGDSRAGGQRVTGALVSGGYFATLGTRPFLGRLIAPEDDGAPGSAAVAVLSYGLWRDRYGGRSDVLGRSLRLNGHEYTVIGVAPPGFRGLTVDATPAVWLPLAMQREAMPAAGDLLESPWAGWLRVVGRPTPGADRAVVSSWLGEWLKSAEAQHPLTAGWSVEEQVWVSPFARDNLTRVLALLGIGASLVMIASCANAMNLLLLQAADRRAEIAVRAALGGGRWRLFRQLLAEAGAVAIVGSVLAFVIAWVGLAALRTLRLTESIVLADVNLHAGLGAALTTVGISMGAAMIVAAAPAWAAAAGCPQGGIRLASRTVAHGPGRLRGSLVATQVALALILLAGAAMLGRSLANLRSVDPGFDADSVAALTVDLEIERYPAQDAEEFRSAALDRLRSLPGVRSASAADHVPFGPAPTSTGPRRWRRPDAVVPEGFPARLSSPDGDMLLATSAVAPDYFRTLSIDVREGRGLTEEDSVLGGAAVVSQSVAASLWPGEAVLGRHLMARGVDFEVVGVVADVRDGSLVRESAWQVYVPISPEAVGAVTFVVRGEGDMNAVLREARSVLQELDSRLVSFATGSLAEAVEDTLWQAKALARLAAAFAVLALGLAAIGLYGTAAFAVRTRSHELGVRKALGASPLALLRFVVGRALVPAGAGVLLGATGVLALGGLLQSQLYGMTATDLRSLATAAALIVAVALVAAVLPSHRAMAIDPVRSLHSD